MAEGASGVLGAGPSEAAPEPVVDVKTLHAKIGELALENDFLFGTQPSRPAERKVMIDRGHTLPVTR